MHVCLKKNLCKLHTYFFQFQFAMVSCEVSFIVSHLFLSIVFLVLKDHSEIKCAPKLIICNWIKGMICYVNLEGKYKLRIWLINQKSRIGLFLLLVLNEKAFLFEVSDV